MLILVEICVQLLYPYDRALPLATVGSVRAGFSTRSDLARIFQEQFEQSRIELKSGERAVSVPIATLGMSLDSDQMASQLTTYSLVLRFVPFSLVLYQPHLAGFDTSIDGKRLAAQSEDIAKQLSYDPTDAALSLKDGKLIVGAAHDGRQVVAGDVQKVLVATRFAYGVSSVEVDGKVVKPNLSDADIADAKQQAAAMLDRTVTLRVTGKGDFVPDAPMRASWLVIDTASKPARLGIDHDALLAYVNKVNEGVAIAPTPTRVSIVDGNEHSRSAGAAGMALDVSTIANQLSEAVLGKGQTTVVASLQPVASPLSYERSYTHSQAGLQAYVAYATSTQNVRIVVQQLDSPGWSASGRANESIPSASTYKLYVMLRVFDDINSGKLTWDTPMLDSTAGGCFERTIVPSTNPCAEEWIRQYGRGNLNDYVHTKGFSNGTGFTFSDATHTTAGDLAKYLIGLHNGTLVSSNNRDMLLEKMSRQLYRYGIPTGTKGWAQDKVGFLWDYIHDAAIVHNPQGTYVMVIMTKGYSYGYIANVAKQIDTILYP